MADTPETPPETKKPSRHLRVVHDGELVDATKPLRRWWKRQHMDELPEGTTLPQAMRDVGIMALGHIAKRLADPKTPMRVKDRMAEVMGPKLGVQLVGRGTGSGDGEGDASRDVLESYRGT